MQNHRILQVIAAIMFAAQSLLAAPADWKPAESPLFTTFSEAVSPDNAWPEYPRPQMVREDWINLNGLWDYALEPVDFEPVQGLIDEPSMTTGQAPDQYSGRILVPFAIDSALSGVGHILRPTERIWYRRSFTLPEHWDGRRVLLHFQGADWETSAYVNGRKVGQHRGGYDPFSFDITDALEPGENEIVACCWDATEQQCQAIGKQVMPENRQGFRYQPTGGIWRTVWLEPVHPAGIEDLTQTTDIDSGELLLDVDCRTGGNAIVHATVRAGDRVISQAQGPAGKRLRIPVPEPRLWSPDDPYLYDLDIALEADGRTIDQVASYFGMRKIEVKKAPDGHTRIFLNREPIFQLGPLDQGYWPDGILTPPSDEAARFDLQFLKDIGCNMVRVHIKTHPDRWYYWADRLGLLVWQDMVCTPKYGQTVDAAASQQWHREFEAMIDWLENHPSIVHWIVFNEAWGQHETIRFTEWTMQRDPTRLVTAASGWTDFPVGHVYDEHDYSFYVGTVLPSTMPDRAVLFGELGGHNVYVPGHTWHENQEPHTKFSYTDEGGRATFLDGRTWQEPYTFFWENLRCLNAIGNNAAIYTQITDVEHECNGWLTYDRKVSKIPRETLAAIHRNFYHPPLLRDLGPGDATWKAAVPARDSKAWTAPGFDDSAWQEVTLPLDIEGVGQLEQTTARRPSLVLRRRLALEEPPSKAALRIELTRVDTGEQPREERDRFTPPQHRPFVLEIHLDGELLRKTNIALLSGETGVAFLPLRPQELELLNRSATLAVLVPDADQLTSVNIRLQRMIEP